MFSSSRFFAFGLTSHVIFKIRMDLTEPPSAAQTSLPSAIPNRQAACTSRDFRGYTAFGRMILGLACCAIEMMSMGVSRFDIARFGAEVFRPSSRQSDLMIIAGRVSNKMAPVIPQLWEQMPEPKMGDLDGSVRDFGWSL
jgi:hypothetical protein